jgi:hypothetical protein
VTGNGVVVLDVDPRNGGESELRDLQKAYGRLPKGPTVITGGGGRHYYFRTQQPIRSAVLAPGIEVKAERSCVVAPPSLHASGEYYSWVPGCGPDIELPVAPEWIFERLHSRTPRQGINTSEICQGFAQGERNSGMTRLAGLLIGKSIPLPLILSLLVSFDLQSNRPPLGEAEVRTIVTSIATRELAKRGIAQ